MTEKAAEFGTFWGAALYDCPEKKDPIIENMLYDGESLVINGESGIGKSLYLMQLMCNLTTGKSFLDVFEIPRPKRVVYLQLEGCRNETVSRMLRMGGSVGINDDNWVHIHLPGIQLNTPEGLMHLRQELMSAAFFPCKQTFDKHGLSVDNPARRLVSCHNHGESRHGKVLHRR